MSFVGDYIWREPTATAQIVEINGIGMGEFTADVHLGAAEYGYPKFWFTKIGSGLEKWSETKKIMQSGRYSIPIHGLDKPYKEYSFQAVFEDPYHNEFSGMDAQTLNILNQE